MVLSKFPLFSLPLVPLKAIYEKLDPVDLIDLSLSSKLARKSIKQCALKVNELTFSPREIVLEFKSQKKLVLDFYSTVDRASGPRTVDGVIFHMWTKSKESGRISCIPNNYTDDILLIYRFFTDLFPIESVSCHVFNSTIPFIEYFMDFLPVKLKDLEVQDISASEEDVFRILDRFEVRSKLVLDSEVQVHEKMLKIENLRLQNCKKMEIESILQLDPECLVIADHKLITSELKQIVTKWKTTPTRLTTLLVNRTKEIPIDSFLEGWKFWKCEKEDDVEHEKFRKIRRDFDRKEAVVGFSYGSFHLQVCEQ